MSERLLLRKVWLAAKSRCYKLADPDYKNYGARGITMSDAWICNFEQFLQDMGPRPYKYRLERKDNDKGYSKENCVWATATQQVYNQRIRCDNTSGIKGVTWDKSNNRWFARGFYRGKPIFLYQGLDLLEACCRRKSWENRNVK